MNKGLCRWKLAAQPGSKLIIKAFDHWKMMIALRKIMRHWLNYSNNRVQFGKADMQEAFSRWRTGDVRMAIALDRQPREYLVRQNLKQSNELIRIANQEADNEGLLSHLNTQRDELLEHYIRGQKLALKTCEDHQLRSRRQAFRYWSRLLKENKQQEGSVQVLQAVESMTELKDRVRELERDNRNLANENGELR